MPELVLRLAINSNTCRKNAGNVSIGFDIVVDLC